MLYANINGEKEDASPGAKGTCPLCECAVFSKCGEVNIWHWAHLKGESCDSWYEPETEWHKNWKKIFGKERSEIVIKKENKRHIADVLTESGVVIELQNSPIQKPVIRKREEFYGEKMLWIINGRLFEDNFQIQSNYNENDYERLLLQDYASRGYNNYSYTPSKSILPPGQLKVPFYWSWARKSWNEVTRNVFIDFGRETLFWVKSGMGSWTGYGVEIEKKKFIEKYGGDINLLKTVIIDKNSYSNF